MATSEEPDQSHVRVAVSTAGAVRTVTLNRPHKRNAITAEMFEQLVDLFTEDPPEALRVSVLRATGSVFCAGVDLASRQTLRDCGGRPALERLCRALIQHPLPVVTAVQGPAIGAGMMVALHSDFVVANRDATLRNAAAQLGLVPDWWPMQRVADVTGRTVARRLLLLGEAMRADVLSASAAIMTAVPSEELEEMTSNVVHRLARNAPLSLRAIKATLTAHPAVPHERLEELVQRARRSADNREGLMARREGREPRFTGS